MALVAVLDYGIGNLHSAQKALQRVGADARLTAGQLAAIRIGQRHLGHAPIVPRVTRRSQPDGPSGRGGPAHRSNAGDAGSSTATATRSR